MDSFQEWDLWSVQVKDKLLLSDIETVYLQEKETKLLVGEATIYLIYSLLYNTENEGGIYSEDGIHLPSIRNTALKEIYFEWCEKNQ